jgi:hypothetical protein
MQDDGAGNWTGALAADYFWSPPAIATVTKDGVVIASVQLWNLPIVMPKNQTTIIANITADPNNADVDGGAMVTLNATGTMVFDGGDKVQNPVLTYTLNYDDNTSQINNTGIFTRYFSTGNHSLTLVVTDDQGHSDSQQITVSLW